MSIYSCVDAQKYVSHTLFMELQMSENLIMYVLGNKIMPSLLSSK